MDRRRILAGIAAGTAASLLLQAPGRTEVGSVFLEDDGFAYDAFDRLPSISLDVPGGTIRLAFAPGPLALPKPAILAWINRAATSVSTYYGHFPVASVRLLIVPVDGDGVQGGTTWGYRGVAIRILLGGDCTAAALDRDWKMTHEMVHTALPNMAWRHNWLSEGLAVYIEPIARVQASYLKPRSIWADMVRDMPQGLPREGSHGLDNNSAWGSTYWGGAIFCLLADIDIRRQTANRLGLQDAMRGVLAAGGTHAVDWPIRRILATADKAVMLDVMSRLYERMGTKPEHVDLPSLWKAMGIVITTDGLELRDDAPLSAARRAITARHVAG